MSDENTAMERVLGEYRVITDHGNPAASYAGAHPLRIRPIGQIAAAMLALRERRSAGTDETGG